MSRRGWLLFAAMCLLWGIPYLFISIALRDMPPTTLVFLRTGVAAVLLLPLALRRGALRPALGHWKAVLAFAALEVTIPWLLLFRAQTRLTSSMAGLLIAAVPLVAALLAWATRSADRLDRRRLLGLLVGLAGVAVLVGIDVRGNDVLAVLEMGGVVLGYAIAPWIVARWLGAVPSLGVIALAMGFTALVYAPVAGPQLGSVNWSISAVASVGVLAVLCTALAFLLFFALIAEVGATRSVVITYINPAVALVLGVIVLSEPLTVGILIGFPLVLAGSILATARPRARPVDLEVPSSPTAVRS